MTQTFLTGIAIILCAGTIGQIMAWRLRLPSILILLGLGTILGQLGLGWLDPDNFLGSNLFPVVSISVAVILFEGGLSLRFPELPGVRAVIFSLISIGMLVTWAISTLAAKYFLEMNTSLALMLGAILTISGPTVVIPLLRHIRPKAPLGEILKWEGILIDPVGALATVFVFEAILAGEFAHAPFFIVKGIIATLIFGGSIGIISGVFWRKL